MVLSFSFPVSSHSCLFIVRCDSISQQFCSYPCGWVSGSVIYNFVDCYRIASFASLFPSLLHFFGFAVCSHYRAGSVRGGWLKANWQVATQIISLRKSYIISKHLQILLKYFFTLRVLYMYSRSTSRLVVKCHQQWRSTLDFRFLSITLGSKIWFLSRKCSIRIISVFWKRQKNVQKLWQRRRVRRRWRFSVAGMSCWRVYGGGSIEKKMPANLLFSLEAPLVNGCCLKQHFRVYFISSVRNSLIGTPSENIARGTTDPGIASITWIISPATKQANSLEKRIQVKHSLGSNFGQMTLPALVLNLPTR